MRAKAKATARTNTGILRCAQNDDVKTNNSRGEAGGLRAFIPTLRVIKPTRRVGHPFLCGWFGRTRATAEADPYGITNEKATARATVGTSVNA